MLSPPWSGGWINDTAEREVSAAQIDCMQGPGYPKFKNDLGVLEIKIGARQFACIGASPPNDHPHIYLDMGESDRIVCPYCSTVFLYTSTLPPFAADPPECVFVDENP
jgi:uncharacterized Zn-finger protein